MVRLEEMGKREGKANRYLGILSETVAVTDHFDQGQDQDQVFYRCQSLALLARGSAH